MSDFVLSVIPTDPAWQPSRESGERMAAILRELLEDNDCEGFDDLAVTVPCCGGATTLDALGYDWPSGYARFEVAIWNAFWDPLPEETLARLGEALGHPVRQVLAHI